MLAPSEYNGGLKIFKDFEISKILRYMQYANLFFPFIIKKKKVKDYHKKETYPPPSSENTSRTYP